MLGCCDGGSDGPSLRRPAGWDDVDNVGAANGDSPKAVEEEEEEAEAEAGAWPKAAWKPRFGVGEPRDEWKEVRELNRGGKKGANEEVEDWLDCRAEYDGSECGCWSGQEDPKIRGKETVRRRSNVGTN